MKYLAGQKVRIKSIDWYNQNKDEYGYIDCGSRSFFTKMSDLCGKIATIKEICKTNCYHLEEYDFDWTDEMIEGLVEEENVHNKWTGLKVELELSKTVIGVSNVESLQGERFMSGFVKAIIPPEGYTFKDENGNIINAQKIVLEKKKKEYPKTYEECAEIITELTGSDCNPKGCMGYMSVQLTALQKLFICRDAYWKIAGDEMELGKPWEPDYTEKTVKYCLRTNYCRIVQTRTSHDNHPFSFPTAEMRDAFKENFDPDIEFCKELL